MDYPAFFSETPNIRIADSLARVSASYGRNGAAACSWVMATIRPGGSA